MSDAHIPLNSSLLDQAKTPTQWIEVLEAKVRSPESKGSDTAKAAN